MESLDIAILANIFYNIEYKAFNIFQCNKYFINLFSNNEFWIYMIKNRYPEYLKPIDIKFNYMEVYRGLDNYKKMIRYYSLESIWGENVLKSEIFNINDFYKTSPITLKYLILTDIFTSDPKNIFLPFDVCDLYKIENNYILSRLICKIKTLNWRPVDFQIIDMIGRALFFSDLEFFKVIYNVFTSLYLSHRNIFYELTLTKIKDFSNHNCIDHSIENLEWVFDNS